MYSNLRSILFLNDWTFTESVDIKQIDATVAYLCQNSKISEICLFLLFVLVILSTKYVQTDHKRER